MVRLTPSKRGKFGNDHLPAHVHVFVGRKTSRNQPDIKINLGSEEQAPKLVSIDSSISDRDAINARKLVAEHQAEFLTKWYQYHGS